MNVLMQKAEMEAQFSEHNDCVGSLKGNGRVWKILTRALVDREPQRAAGNKTFFCGKFAPANRTDLPAAREIFAERVP